MVTATEIRCPLGAHRLLMKVVSEGGKPYVTDGNLLELSCRDCAKQLRKEGEPVSRVLHRYDILGRHVETITE